MSSILKALKKLEKDTQEQQSEPRLSMGLNIRSEKNRRREKFRWLKKGSTPRVWITSLFVCFLGAGAFIILLANDRDSQTVVSNNASIDLKTRLTVKPQVAVTDSPKLNDASPSAHQPHSVQKNHDKPPQTQMPIPRAELPRTNAPDMPAPAATQKSNIPLDNGAPPEPRNLPPIAITKASPNVIAEEPPEPPPAVTQENRANEINAVNEIPIPNEIPSLTDNSLIINAIAWSNDPAKRLAVINSSILRQGQSIGGFLLVKIEEDQVIVQQSDKKWRVKFGLR